jgi:hypothetical protein
MSGSGATPLSPSGKVRPLSRLASHCAFTSPLPAVQVRHAISATSIRRGFGFQRARLRQVDLKSLPTRAYIPFCLRKGKETTGYLAWNSRLIPPSWNGCRLYCGRKRCEISNPAGDYHKSSSRCMIWVFHHSTLLRLLLSISLDISGRRRGTNLNWALSARRSARPGA